jgi:intracellular septation protein A
MSRFWNGVKRLALSSALSGGPAPADGGLHPAFRLRGLIESGLPSVVFVIAFRAQGTRPAALVALVVAGLMVIERLVRRQRPHEAISGVLGVVIAVALAGGTGQAKNFFLPEVVFGLIGAAALMVSIPMGKPLLGVILGAVAPPFRGWRERPLLHRAFVHITAVAGVWALIKALILLSLYLSDDVELLAGAKLALGYPMVGVLFLYYMRVVKRALAAEATTVELVATS